MVAKVPHILTSAGIRYTVLLPDVYGAIGEVVGVKKAGDNETGTSDGGGVSHLVAIGAAIRMKVRCQGKKEVTVVCASDKIKGAEGGVGGKAIGTKTAIKGRVPRRMRLG